MLGCPKNFFVRTAHITMNTHMSPGNMKITKFVVSIKKNPWLWDWIYEKVDQDPEFRSYLVTEFAETRPEEIKGRLIMKLEDFGYKIKLTPTGKDSLIAMSEEEYIFLKLKYS